MSDTNLKERMLKVIEELPADASVEDAMDRLYFMYKVEQGWKDVEAGRTYSSAEIKQRIADKWQR